MNLLQMASNREASADDLVPVLIYVVIMVNIEFYFQEVLVNIAKVLNLYFRQIHHTFCQQFNMLMHLLVNNLKAKIIIGGPNLVQL